ncbi:MAG TPA: YggS family pyridoxal phosphate-dependent enzyme [Segeticoccus sp.]|uniref:YggS family pyridoxal phosphate-dependent enzyme n=1 Tax=Segeticoccus sp. TaxID=2706531 RepID=UPI002D7F6F4E|nr:YggS family pyridoxal phosphate-dependent enzyme [Segeticoccus sp.]HET8601876.1 YggS family pyridoxal phosphate-dependent enzyme [Segeticoccus sp.]
MSAPPSAGVPDAARTAELRSRLTEVCDRIDRACMTSRRDPAEVHLVVVTKYFPSSDVRALASLGVADIGENRDQEAAEKIAELADLRGRLTVHFIGQLQTNKASSVAGYADVVHSVDRPKLVRALDKGAARAGRRLAALVQVDLRDQESGGGRGGASPEQAAALADAVADSEHLVLRGVMAVAPLGADPAPGFARLREVADGIRARHPQANWISAGMSGDLEAAVAHGATHLRVGSAILGSRPPLR